MKSLAGTLYRRVITGTAVVLLIAGALLYLSVNRQMVRQMDESLIDKVRSLTLSVEEKPYGLEVDLEEMRTGEMVEGAVPEYLYIGSTDGRTIYRSRELGSLPSAVLTAPMAEPRYDWYDLPDAGKLRSVMILFQPAVDQEEEGMEAALADPGILVDRGSRPGDPVVLQLFKDAVQHDRFMELFFLMLLTTGLGSLVILSLILWMTIKRGAEPIDRLAATIEAIKDDDLAVRLEESGAIRELIPIVDRINLLLDRLEGSFKRERAFTSDAAHELRTPIAGLKSTLEVALSKRRNAEEYQDTLDKTLTIIGQLEDLVNGLLTLARLESGQEDLNRDEIPLEPIVRDIWQGYREQADERGIQARWVEAAQLRVAGDLDLFIRVLHEVFRNAVFYTDPGGVILLSSAADGVQGTLRVSNSGSRVPAENASRVFDRFWRGSPIKGDTGSRFGLGLAIVQRMMEAMGGSICVVTESGGPFIVMLTLPLTGVDPLTEDHREQGPGPGT